MKRRPMLNQLDPAETALIWNPEFGFRLYSPDHNTVDTLSLPETFLSILHMQVNDEMMMRLTGEYLSHFRKH